MAELSHSVISPMSFRVEYKRNGTGPAMFQRHVRFQVIIITHPTLTPTHQGGEKKRNRNKKYNSKLLLMILSCNHNIEINRNNIVPFQVDLSAICKQEEVSDTLFAITFTLLSGKNVVFFTRIFSIVYSYTYFVSTFKTVSNICLILFFFWHLLFAQVIFEDSVGYVNTFSHKFAQNDFLVPVAHQK